MNSSAATARVRLPNRLRVLFVTPPQHHGGWLADVFAHDLACRVEIVEAQGESMALSRLREQSYDVVVALHESSDFDALALVDALRTAGHDDAVVVVGRDAACELESLAWEVGADAYCCLQTTTARSLLWNCARAMDLHRQRGECRKLRAAEQQRLVREHAEAQHLLAEQRSLVAELEHLTQPSSWSDPPAGGERDLPFDLVQTYRDLLHSQVVMGSGNLSSELVGITHQIADLTLPTAAVIKMHVDAVQRMVEGLGQRSARHLMSRADLLLVDLLSHLADAYRQRYNDAQGLGLPRVAVA